MKTLLIRPSNPTGSAYLTKWGFLPAPLGLLQLAGSLLTLDDSQVRVIDMEADEEKTVDGVVKEALAFDPDIVGLTIHATAAHTTSTEIAKKVKEEKGDALLVAGGHHATFVPYDLLRSGFDVVVLGEGDQTILDVAASLRDGRGLEEVPGILFNRREDGKSSVVQTVPRALIPDLDALPLPALHLVKKEPYTIKVFGKGAVACLETARGCPYACDFCSVTPTWGHRWRNKSNKRILMELELAKRLGYDWIFFTDDIFVVYPNVDRRMALFDAMIENGYDRLKWLVQMRADVTSKNPALIKRGAEAGMRFAFLGVESGSQETLKRMHKGLLTPQSVKAVRILSENGVIVLIGMMLGAPYESFRDMLATLRFSHHLADAGADGVQFTTYTPLPGTRIFDDALKNDRLFTLDWSRYDVLTPVMKTRVNPAIIQMLQFYGNYSFYVLKWLEGKLRRGGGREPKEFKRDLMSNGQKFVFEMIPAYLKDAADFPSQVGRTHRLYSSLKDMADVSKERVMELRGFSSKVIYQETGGKNPYFLIKEAE
ncbi:MAG: B12-binding domain-containing radical SAM protein [Nitrososphaerota archaeon]|nr:B12-binding domain-containing radical SAM protein [Nitrososphaerota archaeon]